MIRRLLDWLSRRFPVQRVVTLEEYQALYLRLDFLANEIHAVQEHLASVSAQVKILNSANGFVNVQKGAMRLER